MHRISAQDSFSARWALASVALSMLLSSLGTSIANVGLPTLALALQVSFQEIQWVVLIYLLAVTTSIVSVGHLGDLIGRRRLLLWGILLFTLASVLCGMALGLWWLVVARALQGIGAAIMMAMSMSFVIDVAPDKTGSAMGLLATMSAIGTALGPSVGGVLIAGFGWRAIFWLLVPLGLIVLALAYRTLPTTAVNTQATPARFDKTGASLLIVTLAAYALSMTWGRGHYGVHNVALLLVAIVGACCFVWVQARVPSPLISMSNTSTPANFLNKTPLPSITGLEASGPILPKPKTAVPFVTTATKLPREVYLNALAGSATISSHAAATPGE